MAGSDVGASRDDRSSGGSTGRVKEVTLLKWRSSLLDRQPKKFYIGLGASLGALALVWVGFPGEPLYLLLALIMLTGALGPLYFPIHYTLTDKRVYQAIFSSKDSFRWEDFDSYRVFDDSVHLHLRPKNLRLRYLKGLTLYFSNNREEVLDVIRQRIEGDEGESSKSPQKSKNGGAQQE